MSRRRIVLLSPFFLFSLSPLVHAVDPPTASQPQTPVYQTHARDVVVDVVVTRSGDQPVTGLRAQDFRVLEEGKPQTIDYFEEHAAKTLPAGALKSLPPMPPGVHTNVPPAPESDAVNVLLLDALNTDQQDQSYVRQNILKFLRNMPPGTRAAIFTLTSRLRMVQGFTSDSTELVAALNDPRFGAIVTKPQESRTMQDKQDDLDDVRRMLMLTGGRMTTGIQVMMDFQREIANMKAGERVGMTLEALQYLARYLAAVPGRKNLLWFSSSFPVSIFPRAAQTQSPSPMNTADLRDMERPSAPPRICSRFPKWLFTPSVPKA